MPLQTRTRLLPESTGEGHESYGTIPAEEALTVPPVRTVEGTPGTSVEEVRRSISLAQRTVQLRRRRRRKALMWTMLAIGLFIPPLWPVFLIYWLVQQSRPHEKSRRRVRQGIHAIAQNKPGIALRALQDAHLLNPSNHDALYWIGMLLADQRRYDEAAEALTALSDRMPGNPEAERTLVDCCFEAGRYEDAIEYAQRVLERDSNDLRAIIRLSDSFDRLGRTQLAIEALRRAPLYRRQFDRNMKDILYRLASLLEREGERTEALALFRRLCAADVGFLDVCARVQQLEK